MGVGAQEEERRANDEGMNVPEVLVEVAALVVLIIHLLLRHELTKHGQSTVPLVEDFFRTNLVLPAFHHRGRVSSVILEWDRDEVAKLGKVDDRERLRERGRGVVPNLDCDVVLVNKGSASRKDERERRRTRREGRPW